MSKTTATSASPALVQNAVVTEELAAEIRAVAAAAKVLLSSKLKKKTVLLLLSHSSGIGQRDVEKVLEAARCMSLDYLNS